MQGQQIGQSWFQINCGARSCIASNSVPPTAHDVRLTLLKSAVTCRLERALLATPELQGEAIWAAWIKIVPQRHRPYKSFDRRLSLIERAIRSYTGDPA